MSIDLLSGDYDDFLHQLKERIRNAQIRAALAVNRELVMLYWQIGQEILTRQVQPELLSVPQSQHMAEFFGALADPHRLRLLSALTNQELCVCDLAAIVKMSESAVSHQLRLLRTLRLVKYCKEGRNVY